MSALVEIPDRDRIEAVLMVRTGMGWTVGIGRVSAGKPEREREAHLTEREARAAALALSDRHDLLILRSDARDG